MIPFGFFRGRVSHRRMHPNHAFERDLLMALVDIESLDAAPQGVLRLAGGWPVSLRRKDHLPAEGTSLSDRVRQLVTPFLGRSPRGPMALLSQPRAFGLTFDPVSFVYCMTEDGDSTSIEAVVAEVTNTPWNERHVYVLTEGSLEASGVHRFETRKSLHVSPFFDMDHTYTFRFSVPGDQAFASISNHRAGKKLFETGLSIERVGDFDATAWRNLARHPWMPAETLVGIYAQAARLAWKGARFRPHPRRRAAGSLDAGTDTPTVTDSRADANVDAREAR